MGHSMDRSLRVRRLDLGMLETPVENVANNNTRSKKN